MLRKIITWAVVLFVVFYVVVQPASAAGAAHEFLHELNNAAQAMARTVQSL